MYTTMFAHFYYRTKQYLSISIDIKMNYDFKEILNDVLDIGVWFSLLLLRIYCNVSAFPNPKAQGNSLLSEVFNTSFIRGSAK